MTTTDLEFDLYRPTPRLGGPFGGGNSLYFAYGSNLDTTQMKSRCPGAIPLVVAKLNSHLLSFQDHANVLPSRRSSILGGVYLIDWRDAQSLDRYEGVGGGYYERVYSSVSWDPGKLLARFTPSVDHLPIFFYRMIDQSQYRGPSDRYFDSLLTGYRDWGLDPRPLMKSVIYGPGKKELVGLPPTKRSKSGFEIQRPYRSYHQYDPSPVGLVQGSGE